MHNFQFDAVIFDLDGVITDTAAVHSTAWKQMFDEYLNEYANETGQPFREFTHNDDYLPYVDGKPRYKGIESFLESRNLILPYGDPKDYPQEKTVCGLGNRKNDIFNHQIDQGNLVVFESTIKFIKELLKNNIKVGVASSSKNCKKILEVAGLSHLFETRVDGLVSAQLGLKGKPEPDIFTTACDNIGVDYDKSVIVEDAISGVQAGRKGQFGLVLGIARENNEKELKTNGADIVISDMSKITFDDINNWFNTGLINDQWTLSYYDYDKKKEGTREALCTIGNGYIGTRGAFEEVKANEFNYPGTYMAGLYNKLTSKVADRDVVNEDFVNCPNWLPVTFKIDDDWIDPNSVEIIDFQRSLNFSDGLLTRIMVIKDNKDRKTRIESKRIISMADMHLAGLESTITPLNYEGKITIRSELDGQVINTGVERYRQLESTHWQPINESGEGQKSCIELKTNQSNIVLAMASKFTVASEKEVEYINRNKSGYVSTTVKVDVKKKEPIKIEKIVAIYSSKESDNPVQSAMNDITKNIGFGQLYTKSKKAWADIWYKIDIIIEGQRFIQKLVRFNLFHTMVSASQHNVVLDSGIPARGLHGEAYRGHIFWDELFILPVYYMFFPETAKSVLMYRYHRLDQARKYAREKGYRGAMFPWQSGSDGSEETQVVHLNPLSGEWGEDYSSLQRHVSLAIAFNIFQYYNYTGDFKFIEEFGAEIFLEICRFWASKSDFNQQTQQYDISGVMGPDEYHEAYPESKSGGLKNNTYTNVMTVWLYNHAFILLNQLTQSTKTNLFEKINLTDNELTEWRDISTKLNIPLSENNVLEQFEGFFNLKELNWESYREKYGNINRMDRILKAEGKDPNDYKVAKQADTLMIFYNLCKNEVGSLLLQTGLSTKDKLFEENFKYYMEHTSHGSTLSKMVHSNIAMKIGNSQLSYELWLQALQSDFQDVQGGTTKEGIHAGVMAGSAFLVLKNFVGLRFEEDIIYIDPQLPIDWRKLVFKINYRRSEYKIEITNTKVKIIQMTNGSILNAINFKNKQLSFDKNNLVEIDY